MSRVTLRSIFGSEMAQDDPNFPFYSLRRTEHLDALANPENFLIILNAARGSGKSGLLISLENSLKESREAVVIRKEYRDMVFPSGNMTVNEGINYWKNTLLSFVVSDIGAKKGWAFADDDISAVELSEAKGDKEKSVLYTVLDRLKFKGAVVERKQFDPSLTVSKLSRIVSNSSNRYWLLLDEMDDIFDNGDELNLLLGLLQASSYIATKFENINIRLTIRPHIMTHLRITNGSIQKLSEAEMTVSWNKSQLIEMIARRLDFYEQKNSNELQATLELTPAETERRSANASTKLISSYFSDFDMSFKNGSSSDYRAFATLCFYRPRWLIEFCKETRRITEEGQQSTLFHYKRAFVPFGNRRIQFVTGEYSNIYPFLQQAMNALIAAKQAGFGKSKKLRSQIINRIIMSGIITCPEHEYQRTALDVAKALYVAEFIRGKSRISGAGGYHRFYYYTDRPDLLTTWQHDPDILWEIHPTYARAFNLVDSQAYKVSEEIKLVGKNIQDRDGAR